MSFDYTAPAELFLAKRPKNGRKNYERFTTAAEAIRYAVEDLKPSARGCRLGMSASTAAKSNNCMKPPTIRCASLNDRASRARSQQN